MSATGAYIYASPGERIRIKQEADELQLEVVRLRRRFNASAPVMRLPNELLVQVFALCSGPVKDPREVSLYSDAMIWSNLPRYQWLRLTHVCQHWRKVALDTPALWTDIDVTRPELVESFVARSKGLPLDISFCRMPKYPPTDAWAAVMQAVPHMRSLVLDINQLSDLAVLTPELQQNPTLSELRSLALQTWITGSETLPVFLLPPFTFPALRSLTTSRLYYDVIRHSLVPSLTSLTLQAPYVRSFGDWRPLLESLDKLIMLEHLALEDTDTLPHNYNEMTSLSNTVARLPSLRTLTISSHCIGAGAALLLRSLCFPGDATFSMGECAILDGDLRRRFDQPQPLVQEHVACLLRALEARLSKRGTGDLTPHLPILSLSLTLAGRDDFVIKGWATYMPPEELFMQASLAPSNKDAPCFAIQWPLEAERMNCFLRMLDRVPSLHHVRSLVIALPAHATNRIVWEQLDKLQDVFVHLQHVKSMLVSGGAKGPALVALKTPYGAGQKMVLPSLKRLHLYNYLFDVVPLQDGVAMEDQGEGQDEGYVLVKRALEERVRSGLRLHTLALSFCEGVERFMVEELRALVSELVWDEFEYIAS